MAVASEIVSAAWIEPRIAVDPNLPAERFDIARKFAAAEAITPRRRRILHSITRRANADRPTISQRPCRWFLLP
jgi:hypothetical protein